MFAADRIDAEYYNPAKSYARACLSNGPAKPLESYYRSVREMLDPSRAPGGEMVLNFDLDDALHPVLRGEYPTMLAKDLGSNKKRFKPGDVVISRLRAYLREIALIQTSPNVSVVGSSEFIVLRPQNEDHPILSQAALLLLLRSKPVQTILRWSQDGSHHPRFGEEDLLSIPVPDAICEAALEVDLLLEDAFEARRRADQLLSTARHAVEITIQRSESAALAYLESN